MLRENRPTKLSKLSDDPLSSRCSLVPLYGGVGGAEPCHQLSKAQ